MPLGLLGKKLGHTRVYDANGVAISVTVVLAGPNRVIQVKTQAGKDGYNAVQLGLIDQKEQRVTKPLLGHFKKFGATPVKKIKEFRNFSKEVKPGEVVGATLGRLSGARNFRWPNSQLESAWPGYHCGTVSHCGTKAAASARNGGVFVLFRAVYQRFVGT